MLRNDYGGFITPPTQKSLHNHLKLNKDINICIARRMLRSAITLRYDAVAESITDKYLLECKSTDRLLGMKNQHRKLRLHGYSDKLKYNTIALMSRGIHTGSVPSYLGFTTDKTSRRRIVKLLPGPLKRTFGHMKIDLY